MWKRWKHFSKKEDEITPKDIEKLPNIRFVNITGSKPFLRDNLDEIIAVVKPKVKRAKLLGDRGCEISQEA